MILLLSLGAGLLYRDVRVVTEPMIALGFALGALSVELAGTQTGWTLGTLIITGSVLVHGATAVPATLAYGRLTE